MLESILDTCSGDMQLCIAMDITLPDEAIKTMTISEWKKQIPIINDRLVVFVLQQSYLIKG
jgi:16S rRNA (cytidine1402-2'-O)-methyltransferase